MKKLELRKETLCGLTSNRLTDAQLAEVNGGKWYTVFTVTTLTVPTTEFTVTTVTTTQQ